VSLVYGPATLQLDPIEKEPIFHNLPGAAILCSGTAGCNFRCRFCHNWRMSQRTVEELAPYTREVSAAEVVRLAQRLKADLRSTYNEPAIFHTNGGMRPEPLRAPATIRAGRSARPRRSCLLRHQRRTDVALKRSGFSPMARCVGAGADWGRR
jgi:hypothetical protein